MKQPIFGCRGARGMHHALPIAAAYFPFDVAFGVAATDAGLSVANTLAMTMLVYAASAQMAALGLLVAGASPLTVVGMTLLLNLRYVLFSAGLAPHASRWNIAGRAAVAGMTTDATYAVVASGAVTGQRDVLTFHAVPYLLCALGTYLGAALGAGLPDMRIAGLDFALPAMLVALLAPLIQDRAQAVTAVLAAAVSLIFVKAGVGTWSVIVAALTASLAMLAIKTKLSWIKFL